MQRTRHSTIGHKRRYHDPRQGVPGSFTIAATGSPAPTIAASGALDGLSIAGGVLFGGRDVNRYVHITFTAHNGVGVDATQSFVPTVVGSYVSTTSLSGCTRGTFYHARLNAIGGAVPYK